MSTPATIVRQNLDGSFSSRYHHYDGYIEGLGLFLHEHVSSTQHVDFVFDLEKSFSSIMLKKMKFGEKAYYDDVHLNRVVHYPSFFALDKSHYMATMYTGTDLVKNNVLWDELNDHQTSFVYIFCQNTWNVVIQQARKWSDSVIVSVQDYRHFLYTLHHLRDTAEEMHQSISTDPVLGEITDQDSGRFFMDVAKKWVCLPAKTRNALINYYTDQYDLDDGVMERFHSIITSYVQKSDITNALSEVLPEKPFSSSRKI